MIQQNMSNALDKFNNMEIYEPIDGIIFPEPIYDNISDNYEGTQFAIAIPLNFEIFRIISSMRFKELQSQIITKMGVMTLDLSLDNAKFKFVISALAN